MPGRDVPHISFLEMLSFDKWVHASIFFVLTLLLAKAIHLSNNQSTLYLLIATATVIVYGGALEIMQGLEDLIDLGKLAAGFDIRDGFCEWVDQDSTHFILLALDLWFCIAERKRYL